MKPNCQCGEPAWIRADLTSFNLCVESIDACEACVLGRWREHLHHADAVGVHFLLHQDDGTLGERARPAQISFCRYRPLNLLDSTISIDAGGPHMQTESALVEGGLALYKRSVHDWRVIHRPSGAAIAQNIRAKWRAKKLMSHLLPLLDWRETEVVLFKQLFADPDLSMLIAMAVERAVNRTLTARSRGKPVPRKKRKRIKISKKRRVSFVRGIRYAEWISTHGAKLASALREREEGDD